ncbi:MAG: hypothetical protein KUG79_00215 [Pseudomonadales bacterium]|nr:hypothetical protein [Pseudomonadales bacterium]
MSVIQVVERTFKDANSIARKVEEHEVVDKVLEYFKENIQEIALDDTDWIKGISSGKGIYYFEVKFPSSEKAWAEQIELFGENWKNWKENKTGIVPDFQLERSRIISNTTTNDDWLPFYIGKRDNVCSRIKEHILGVKNEKTGALRLNDRKKELAEFSFRLSYITFELSKEEYRLMAYLENGLRNNLTPIIGRQ